MQHYQLGLKLFSLVIRNHLDEHGAGQSLPPDPSLGTTPYGHIFSCPKHTSQRISTGSIEITQHDFPQQNNQLLMSASFDGVNMSPRTVIIDGVLVRLHRFEDVNNTVDCRVAS